MFVRRLAVRNYRGFREFSADLLPGINIIVGANGSGKSTILEALNLVLSPYLPWYRGEVLTKSDFHCENTDEPIQIDVWLSCGEVKGRNARCGACPWLKPATADTQPCPFVAEVAFWHETAGRFLTASDFGPEASEDASCEQIVGMRFLATWNDELVAAEPSWSLVDEAGEPFSDRSSSYRTERQWLGFYRLRDVSSWGTALSFSESSMLSRLVAREELRRISRSVLSSGNWESAFEAEPSVTDILEYYDEQMRGIVPDSTFGVMVRRDRPTAILNVLELGTETRLGGATGSDTVSATAAEGQPQHDVLKLPLSRRGEGIRHVAGLLTAARLVSRSDRHAIVAIEEPERHLEPHLQRWLVGDLLEGRISSESQVVLTTHSPEIVRATRSLSSVMVLRQASSIHRLSGKTANCVARWQWADLHNALFADKVLVVEGETEFGFYPELFRRCAQRTGLSSASSSSATHDALTLERYRLEIVNGHGCTMKAVCRVVREIGAEIAVVMDGDGHQAVDDVSKYADYVFHLPPGVAFEALVAGWLESQSVEEQATFFAHVLEIGGDEVMPWGKLKEVAFSVSDGRTHLFTLSAGRPQTTPRHCFKEQFAVLGRPLKRGEIINILKAEKGTQTAQRLATALVGSSTEPPEPFRPGLEFLTSFAEGSLSRGVYTADGGGLVKRDEDDSQ